MSSQSTVKTEYNDAGLQDQMMAGGISGVNMDTTYPYSSLKVENGHELNSKGGNPERRRLVILYDKPRYMPMKTQLQQLQQISYNMDILEFKDLEKFQHLPLSTNQYYYLNICIEYNDEFETNLRRLNEFLSTKHSFLSQVQEIGYHINFDINKKWDDYQQFEREEYFKFLATLNENYKDRVRQASIINKYDINTIYLMEKTDLTKLGEEIQQDIHNWNNLKVLDYSNNCIRFFPGVKFPDGLEIMNISGSYSLETLSGFKMPVNLKQLIASNNSISSIDNITFPENLQVLNLMDNRIYFLTYVELPGNLRTLDLSNNRIDNVRNVEFPRTLQNLSLALNPIDNIKGVRFPEGLRHLDISCIPNESLAGIKFPDSLISLNLQESMTNTRGLKLPNYVKNLNLSHDGVNSINPLKLPNSIEVLNLTNNNIKSLNKVQFPLNLKHLYLGNNSVTTLKNVIFPSGLETLDLEMDPYLEDNDKRITTLKDVIFPRTLKVLKLGYQGIKSLESVELPENLIELDLSYNDLRLIRNVRFGNKLQKLNISGNQELIEIDQIIIPSTVKELMIPSQLIPNLPGYIIERANSKDITITKSLPY